jgi:hypothetical protein
MEVHGPFRSLCRKIWSNIAQLQCHNAILSVGLWRKKKKTYPGSATDNIKQNTTPSRDQKPFPVVQKMLLILAAKAHKF